MNWYIAIENEQRGPFPVNQLLQQGLTPETLAWCEGMPQWQPASRVPELQLLFGPAAPAIPPAPPMAAVPPPAGYPQIPAYARARVYEPSEVNSKKIAAGVCGILLGSLGIHKFILGMTTPGLVMLLVTLLTCGMGGFIMYPIGLVEGIIYLTKSDQEFYEQYIVGRRSWF